MSSNHCTHYVKRADFDRYLTALYAPAAKRDGLFALYALHLELMHVPHAVSEALLGEMRYAWWREALAELVGNDESRGHPVLAALRPLRDFLSSEVRCVNDMIEAHIKALYAEKPRPLDHARLSDGTTQLLAVRYLGGGAQHYEIERAAHHVGTAYGLVDRYRRVAPDDALLDAATNALKGIGGQLPTGERDMLAALLPAVLTRHDLAHRRRIAAAAPGAMRQLKLAWAAYRGRY